MPEDVPEDNEVTISGSRHELNTHKTPYYGRTPYLDVINIDKIISLHGGPSMRQLVHLNLER